MKKFLITSGGLIWLLFCYYLYLEYDEIVRSGFVVPKYVFFVSGFVFVAISYTWLTLKHMSTPSVINIPQVVANRDENEEQTEFEQFEQFELTPQPIEEEKLEVQRLELEPKKPLKAVYKNKKQPLL